MEREFHTLEFLLMKYQVMICVRSGPLSPGRHNDQARNWRMPPMEDCDATFVSRVPDMTRHQGYQVILPFWAAMEEWGRGKGRNIMQRVRIILREMRSILPLVLRILQDLGNLLKNTNDAFVQAPSYDVRWPEASPVGGETHHLLGLRW